VPSEHILKRSKITVRIWKPAWDSLVRRTDEACLRRDLLISQTLKLELPRVRDELPHANTPRVRRFIESSLRRLFASAGAVQTTLALEPWTAALLTDVCDEKNIPREALLNRLVLLLGTSGDVLDHYLFMTPTPPPPSSKKRATAKRDENADVRRLTADVVSRDPDIANFDLAFAPLGRITAIVRDPLRRYRELMEMLYLELMDFEKSSSAKNLLRKGRYAFTPFGVPLEDDDLIGLNCYLDDRSMDNSWPDWATRPQASSNSKSATRVARMLTQQWKRG